MMSLFQRGPETSVLALVIDGRRLHGAVVQRVGATLATRASFRLDLALDLLSGEPELVAQEIRNGLDKAGIRERRCVVGLPLDWVLSLQVAIPDIPEGDVESFLEIEAERGLPCGPDAAIVARSRFVPPGSGRHAFVGAIPRERVLRIDQVLTLARLRPVSFGLGIDALHAGEASAPASIGLAPGESRIEMILNAGGVALMRSFEGLVESVAGDRVLDVDGLARELRITLGQLPPGTREAVRRVCVYAGVDDDLRFGAALRARLEPMGFVVDWRKEQAPGDAGVQLTGKTPISPAWALAARRLQGHPTPFEFLPPKVTALQQWSARFSSKALQTGGAIAAGLLLLLVAGFAWQSWELGRLQSEWSAIAPKVRELEELQGQIKACRGWFDESFQYLQLMKTLAEAFPEDGSVTAKSIEIRNGASITCTGTARDNPSLLRITDRLGNCDGINTKGKAPLQFTFNWRPSERRTE